MHLQHGSGEGGAPQAAIPAVEPGPIEVGAYAPLGHTTLRILMRAQGLAGRRGCAQVDAAHVLLALIAEPDCLAQQAISGLEIDTAQLAADIDTMFPPAAVPADADPAPSPSLMKALGLASLLARRLRGSPVGSDHLLLGVIGTAVDPLAGILALLGVETRRVQAQAAALRLDLAGDPGDG
jgi:ATP-dependent Clp protease ATP-binding subunit ClpA